MLEEAEETTRRAESASSVIFLPPRSLSFIHPPLHGDTTEFKGR